jgi:hypothetical protein
LKEQIPDSKAISITNFIENHIPTTSTDMKLKYLIPMLLQLIGEDSRTLKSCQYRHQIRVIPQGIVDVEKEENGRANVPQWVYALRACEATHGLDQVNQGKRVSMLPNL